MSESIGSRLKHAWNVFLNRDPTPAPTTYTSYYGGYSYSSSRRRLSHSNGQSIITAIFNQIALDVAQLDVKHVRVDENGRFTEEMHSGLNECLTLSANIDQTGRAFKQDIVLSLLDEGCVAIVPTDTKFDPRYVESIDIEEMRTGKIVEWFPDAVKINLFNEKTGRKEDVILPKSMVAIVENPLYSVINEPNSTYRRLVRKLDLLDVIDEQSGSGKLDLIIQLPYAIKSEARRQQAAQRKRDIEMQITDSKYGIAYIDSAEHVIQLNRPVENNLMIQIEYLTKMLYSQLGIDETILNGTADEKTMLNYYARTVEPIATAIADEFKRKFLTKTARTQGQSIMIFRSPFKLTPISDIAEIGDKFTRNEIMSSNEVRQFIGMKPSKDPKADMLVNSNINQSEKVENKINEERGLNEETGDNMSQGKRITERLLE
jgi:hypothetical protein